MEQLDLRDERMNVPAPNGRIAVPLPDPVAPSHPLHFGFQHNVRRAQASGLGSNHPPTTSTAASNLRIPRNPFIGIGRIHFHESHGIRIQGPIAPAGSSRPMARSATPNPRT